MKYLVVDDSRMARKMLIRVLNKHIDEKDEVLQAENGAQAVDLYMDHTPDLVFMDLTMPVMDGFEAVLQIKTFDENAKILAVSADIQQGAIDKVIQNGALKFIQKPIDSTKMNEIFEEFVSVEV